MKYEAVFGPQELFLTLDKDVVAVSRMYNGAPANSDNGFHTFSQKYVEENPYAFEENPLVAMRRIVEETPKPEPKRWTVEDQKAGRLPEVGCAVYSEAETENVTVIAIDNEGQVWAQREDGYVVCLHVKEIKPIETPEEKAQRLEDEWVDNAYGCSLVFGGTAEGEKARLRKHFRAIRRAMLSGELEVPGGA